MYIHIYISKYTPLSLYVTYKNVFESDHLLLDNELLCSYLEKSISSTLIFPQLSVALCVGFILCRLSHSTLACLVQLTFWQSYC